MRALRRSAAGYQLGIFPRGILSAGRCFAYLLHD
jgi:hypothetical protein